MRLPEHDDLDATALAAIRLRASPPEGGARRLAAAPGAARAGPAKSAEAAVTPGREAAARDQGAGPATWRTRVRRSGRSSSSRGVGTSKAATSGSPWGE